MSIVTLKAAASYSEHALYDYNSALRTVFLSSTKFSIFNLNSSKVEIILETGKQRERNNLQMYYVFVIS